MSLRFVYMPAIDMNIYGASAHLLFRDWELRSFSQTTQLFTDAARHIWLCDLRCCRVLLVCHSQSQTVMSSSRLSRHLCFMNVHGIIIIGIITDVCHDYVHRIDARHSAGSLCFFKIIRHLVVHIVVGHTVCRRKLNYITVWTCFEWQETTTTSWHIFLQDGKFIKCSSAANDVNTGCWCVCCPHWVMCVCVWSTLGAV